jgi:hypothetical protein
MLLAELPGPDEVRRDGWRLSGRLLVRPFGLSPATLFAAIAASRSIARPTQSKAMAAAGSDKNRAAPTRPATVAGWNRIGQGWNRIEFLHPRDEFSPAIKAAAGGKTVIPTIKLVLPSGAVLRLGRAKPTSVPTSSGQSLDTEEQIRFTFEQLDIDSPSGGTKPDDWA